MAYQHIFFDLDHTLWDFERNANETLSELFENYNLKQHSQEPLEVFLQNFHSINNNLWDLYNVGKISQADLRNKRFNLVFKDFINFDRTQVFADEYLNKTPQKPHLIPFAKEILDYLSKKNYHLHIITNGFSDTQFIKLKSGEIHHYFKNVFTSSISGFKKPEIEMFEYAISQSKANIENSIMIGDTIESDIIGALNAGIDTVFYNPLAKTHNSKPTFEIINLNELKQIL